MDRIALKAEERTLLGKNVKRLRAEGRLPAHVFGKGLENETVSVDGKTFLKTYKEAGATAVIDLKIGEDKVRPVMVKEIQYNPVTGDPVHIDFYQVNLSVKVTVPVPLELVGEEPEKVHLGEAILLQTLNELQMEALPNDLIEKIEVDTSSLKEIDDAITVGQLNYDKEKLTVLAGEDEIVVKLAPAVSAEMEALLEEQAADTAEAAAEAATEEGEGEAKVEGEEGAEGSEETPTEGTENTEEKAPDESAKPE